MRWGLAGLDLKSLGHTFGSFFLIIFWISVLILLLFIYRTWISFWNSLLSLLMDLVCCLINSNFGKDIIVEFYKKWIFTQSIRFYLGGGEGKKSGERNWGEPSRWNKGSELCSASAKAKVGEKIYPLESFLPLEALALVVCHPFDFWNRSSLFN